jgi:hypothetical protein
VKRAIVAALMVACDAGEPPEKLPAPPILDEHLLAIAPLAMPHGDFADRASYERALHDYASKRAKVVLIAACAHDACLEAARNAHAGRVVLGTIERNGDKTYMALELVGLTRMSYVHWSSDSVEGADRFFTEDSRDMLAKLIEN